MVFHVFIAAPLRFSRSLRQGQVKSDAQLRYAEKLYFSNNIFAQGSGYWEVTIASAALVEKTNYVYGQVSSHLVTYTSPQIQYNM
jgi:hypothetical protein